MKNDLGCEVVNILQNYKYELESAANQIVSQTIVKFYYDKQIPCTVDIMKKDHWVVEPIKEPNTTYAFSAKSKKFDTYFKVLLDMSAVSGMLKNNFKWIIKEIKCEN